MESKYISLQKRLEEDFTFPLRYMYKFIIPPHQEAILSEHFKDAEVTKKLSKSGKYLSFTAIKVEKTSKSIILKYKSLAHIEGILSI